MIESICSNCGSKKVFDDDKAGKKFKCPTCETVVLIGNIDVNDSIGKEVKPEIDIKIKINIDIDIDGERSIVLEDLKSLDEILSTAQEFWIVTIGDTEVIGDTHFCQFALNTTGSGTQFEIWGWKKKNIFSNQAKSDLVQRKKNIIPEEAIGLTKNEILRKIQNS